MDRQPVSSTGSTPTGGFLGLPSEIRNGIYELVLLLPEPIDPWMDFSRQEKLTLGLFSTNKTINNEACSLFYGKNRFDFTTATPEKIDLFLKQIGPNNTGYIQHIWIRFPRFLYLDPGEVTLEEDSITILSSIHSSCVNLSTFTTTLYSTNAMENRLENLDNYQVASEALSLVDTRFRAISSLREIILQVYEDSVGGGIRNRMKSLGWTISIMGYAQEDDWSDRYDDYDYYDHGDYDDYDIHNDSDFWRRMADDD